METNKEHSEVIFEIKNDTTDFDEQRFIEYAKKSIENLCDKIKDGETDDLNVKTSEKLVEKILANKEKYRISNDIDRTSVQFAKIVDYEKTNERYIKVYMSITFYDNTRNNSAYALQDESMWNDIWNVTFKEINNHNRKCANCGGHLIYNKENEVFKCAYCNSTFQFKSENYWQIEDIEIK